MVAYVGAKIEALALVLILFIYFLVQRKLISV